MTIKNRWKYLGEMLSKYGHRWGETPSTRMYSWVDEYNDLRAAHKELWLEYCNERGFDPSSNAYDSLA